MEELNLPEASLNIKTERGKEWIFDRLRRRFVRLTPEEYVRQRFIYFLIDYLGYPGGRMANEVSIVLGRTRKRCDTVIYDGYVVPLMIIEYKSPNVGISQTVFDQIVRYNMTLNVPWLVITNGIEHYCCHIDRACRTHRFEKKIPEYSRLL
ncbi:MAG: type I restriction enzyme HsdR N-terminal domain-containing protein [Dysgonamonadaceae bacterium]|jgi:hypothetical protein|nr:type I restriction enzyme HsdR N-terminal domain-containing protein [Dysgonamonadaceae bacterium]